MSWSWRKMLLVISVTAVVAVSLAPTEAAARRRGYGMSPEYYDRYYCGRLPAYGTDGCGYREFGYGPDSCWRRVIAGSPNGPVPRRVYVCG